MHGIVAENWRLGVYVDVLDSFEGTWGIQTPQTWTVNHDYDQITIIVADHVYTWFMLKWPELV